MKILNKLGLFTNKREAQGYVFVFPWIIGFLMFFIYPLIQSIRLSFSKITRITGFKMEFAGFGNYAKAFVWDINFVPMFLEVVKKTFINTPIIIVFSLIISVMLNKNIRFRTFFRGLFFLPVLLGTGFVMQQLLGQGVDQQAMDLSRGILLPQQALMYLGPKVHLVIQNFLNLITILLWKSGVQILLFLAGLQGISGSLYEAARCDSATEWTMFWKITVPMISPVTLLNIIYTLIDSFTDTSNPIVTYIIDVGIKNLQLEYGAAMGWIYFMFIFLLILLLFFIAKIFIYKTSDR